MPELAKWVNGHHYDGARLSRQQRSLRDFYGRLLKLAGEPAFRDGEFFPLNPANIGNPDYGRLPGETVGGHWLYSYVRRDPATGQCCVVVANLHPTETFRNVFVKFSPAAFAALLPANAVAAYRSEGLIFTDRLSSMLSITLKAADCVPNPGIEISLIPPLTPCYFFNSSPSR
jgi:hypothetical protein